MRWLWNRGTSWTASAGFSRHATLSKPGSLGIFIESCVSPFSELDGLYAAILHVGHSFS